ncbi:type II secretion system major pseudopilin GspG [Marinospirillum sp. MEB164]|uniref:Type II secretion system core protein G n=1 Tax=Marinospirillum alkalitolerans TaxID=3123374 RepID=A0ABW8Q0T2_9GAMM
MSSAAPAHRLRQTGFTLLEVMVVLVIIGLLIAIVAPNVLDNQDRAMVQKARADIASLEQAVTLYRLDNFNPPTTEQGLEALVRRPTVAPLPQNYRADGYLGRGRVPLDPWGNPYQYRSPGEHGRFDIFSFGADGRPGGEGINAEIGNWQL